MGRRLPLLIMLLLTTAIAACAPERGPASEAVTSRLPSLPLTTLDGRTEPLDALLGGQPVLVSLWATWCDACMGELDALNRLAERGQRVLGIAVGEPRDTVAAFAAKHGLRYPLVVDEAFALADTLGERRVPATLVVDKAGRVVFRGGALDERALEALRSALR